jgi:hypothetical protein
VVARRTKDLEDPEDNEDPRRRYVIYVKYVVVARRTKDLEDPKDNEDPRRRYVLYVKYVVVARWTWTNAGRRGRISDLCVRASEGRSVTST